MEVEHQKVEAVHSQLQDDGKPSQLETCLYGQFLGPMQSDKRGHKCDITISHFSTLFWYSR